MANLFKILLATLLISTTILANEGNLKIKSFSKSKSILDKKIYNEDYLKFDFYTGCSYERKDVLRKKPTKSGKKYMSKLVIDKSSCGFKTRLSKKGKYTTRGDYIEWEHLVPIENVGRTFKSWREGHPTCKVQSGKKKGELYKGRRCAKKVSPEFRRMEADLFNLVPANGQINGDRSNYTFTELEGEPRLYGETIDFEIDFKARKAEPNNEMKGQIARTYLYFNKVYNMRLSKKQTQLYTAWNKMYPLTDLELNVIKKKEKIQGNKFIY